MNFKTHRLTKSYHKIQILMRIMLCKTKVVPTTEKGDTISIIHDTILKNIERMRLNKRVESTVAVKSIPGATKNDIKDHVREYLQDSSNDTAIFDFGTNH